MRNSWRVSLSFLLASVASMAHGATVCKPELIGEVDLHVSADGAVFVPAMLNGHDVFFVLDIASGLPMVFDSVLQGLGLAAKTRAGGGDITWGGKPITHYAKLDDLRVGTFKMLSRNALVIPVEPGAAPSSIAGRPVIGIMGSTLIRNVDAELFVSAHKLRFFKPIACRNGTPVYWGGEAAALPMHWDAAGTPVFILELNGKRIEASLLAGNGVTTIDENAARQFFGIDKDGGAGQSFHPMSLTGTGIEIHDAPVRLRPDSCKLTHSTPIYGAIGYARCVNQVPFNLGTDLLRQLRVYISNKQQTVFMSRVSQSEAAEADAVAIAPAQ